MGDLVDIKEKFFDIVHHLKSNDKISHAYLVEVDNYNDDFAYIIDFVKIILCPKNISFPKLNCSECQICKLINEGNYPDLMIIEPDGQWIKKNQLLQLQSEYKNKSFLENKRIYIIKEADKLNSAAGNTILKFLEEPQSDIVAILLTTNRYKVLETILSRCQLLTIKDNLESKEFDSNILSILKYIQNGDDLFINFNQIYNDIIPDKNSAKKVLMNLESLFLNYLNAKAINDFSKIDDSFLALLSSLSDNFIIFCIDIIEQELVDFEYNINYKLWLASFFSKIIGGESND